MAEAERTGVSPSVYEAKLHATDSRPQSVIAGRTPEGYLQRVLQSPTCLLATPSDKQAVIHKPPKFSHQPRQTLLQSMAIR
jgi:hypothetical protein